MSKSWHEGMLPLIKRIYLKLWHYILFMYCESLKQDWWNLLLVKANTQYAFISYKLNTTELSSNRLCPKWADKADTQAFSYIPQSKHAKPKCKRSEISNPICNIVKCGMINKSFSNGQDISNKKQITV